MIVLKILLWIILIILILVLLAIIGVLIALSIKLHFEFDYTDDKKRLKIKYGIIPIKVYPEMFEPEAVAKRSAKLTKLKEKLIPILEKLKIKVKENKEKSDIKESLKNAEDFKTEEERIAAEQARLDAEMVGAQADYDAALMAEENGEPLPDVLVNSEKVSKIEYMKERIDELDYESAYDSFKNFFSGFDFDTLLALLSYIGDQTSKSLKKFVSRIKIKKFCVYITVGGDDAAKTAIKLGQISAISFPAFGKLVSAAKIKDCDLDISPDFLSPKDKLEFSATVAIRPLYLVTPWIGYLMKVGKHSFSFYKSTKKGSKKKKGKKSSEKLYGEK